jgi:rubrerythrin
MPPHELTASEALGVAIRAEIDASEIYTELANRVPNPFLQQKINLLAKEELQHKRILEEAFKAQFPEVPLALPSSQLPKEISCTADRKRLSVSEVLSCAIEEERKSRQFYLQAAEHAADLSGQRMFNYLADWEFSHEMALTAERDMLLRYPRYYEQTAEPWKPEFRH